MHAASILSLFFRDKRPEERSIPIQHYGSCRTVLYIAFEPGALQFTVTTRALKLYTLLHCQPNFAGHPERKAIKIGSAGTCTPPPPANTHPLQTPPPPGDRHFHVFLVNMYCAGFCCPSALRMALHCFPITSNQAPVCVL